MSRPLLQPGEKVRLHLDSLAVGGEAVGRHQGMAVFAMWGCPGDEAEVEITDISRRFARGVVRDVITPSADRVAPPCPHFGDCGGCHLQHITYPAQLRHKSAMVRDALARIGRFPEVEVRETWGMDHPWRYRGRAQYHAHLDESGRVEIGFARYRSHEIVGLRQCGIQHPLSERVRAALLELLPRIAQGGRERAAVLEVETLVSFASGRALVTLVCDGRPPFLRSIASALMEQVSEVTGVLAAQKRGRGSPHRSPSEVVAGASHVVEEIAGGHYRVSADSFFQANPQQAARMVQLVQEWAALTTGDVVADLYTGVGTFLLPLARSAGGAVGVESDHAAAADARANLRRWRLGNVTLHHRKAERVLPRLVQEGLRAQVVVLDPPRRGCGPAVCTWAARLQPRRIILVSCHPATLARDLQTLADLGYSPVRIQPVDMFPHTWHVEAVALCERNSTGRS
jgi:23S rRNA (uracil1939-C5)-methyltransferase